MAIKETQITAEGLQKLEEELAQRKSVIREEILERIFNNLFALIKHFRGMFTCGVFFD